MRNILLGLVLISLLACTPAKEGDTLLVTYTGKYQNGTIFDTNDPAHASEFPDAPASKFEPLEIRLGQSSLIPGFERELYGMREGSSKTFTVPAKDAYGAYDSSKLSYIPKASVIDREIAIQRNQVVPLHDALGFGGTAEVGTTFETKNFRFRIDAIEGQQAHVYIMHSITRPLELPDMPWTSSHVRGDADVLVYRHDVEDGTTYQTASGPVVIRANETHITIVSLLKVGNVIQTRNGQARVIAASDQQFTLDSNHPLAGHHLAFTVTVESITPSSSP